MKVLMVVDSLAVGGSERSLVEIATNLHEVEPSVVTVYAEGPLVTDLDAVGIAHRCLAVDSRYGLGRAASRLRAVVRELRPDVVHSSLVRSGLVARLALRNTGMPLIHSLVSEPLWSARRPAEQRTLKRRILHMLDRMSSRRVDLFAANSRAVASAFREQFGIDENRVRTIYRGREALAGSALAQERERQLRRDLGIADQDVVLLNVGRLHPSKQQEALIAALPEILNSRPQVVVAIAGEGGSRRRLEEQAVALGVASRLRLLGQRRDVSALLGLSSVFVFPSRYEGLPGALIEAMHAGKAIVASDIPVHGEMLGIPPAGVLVPVGDTRALSAAVLELLCSGEVRDRLGAAAQARARGLFSLRGMVEGYEALYLELARSGRQGRR